MVAISGDTKADSRFEKMIYEVSRTKVVSWDNMLVFHDFSYWDAPSRQVHACKSDFDVEYSSDFRKNAILYHNAKCDIAGNLYVFDNGKITTQ